jgi:4-phospho-D-threonate 3-dehydrogenase / 4-phospho-D-erythronate 3-dehydrogenase
MPQTLDQPTVALTMGDPAGVGPEVVLKALADPEVAPLANWIVVGDSHILERAAAITGVPLSHARLHDAPVLGSYEDFAFGKLDARCGAAAVEYVRIATMLCVDGAADAMVTAPLNKEAVTLSGRRFSGHTEYIAELCGATESRMLLASERLSTIHVTTHVPLRHACELTTARVLRTIELGDHAMKLLGFVQPRIAVCGLNPHAGEHGLFGSEDEQVIAPAIQAAQSAGIRCSGPHAGDTIFLQASRGAYDLVVAMYHDQGHIPMKLIDFEGTVNISLGIPIIRTSVDHGTAFDIAGRNLADPRSMMQAMRMAARMARTRRAGI